MDAIQNEITSTADIEHLISTVTNESEPTIQRAADPIKEAARCEDEVTETARREEEELGIYEDEGSGTEAETEIKEIKTTDQVSSANPPAESHNPQTPLIANDSPSLLNDPSLNVTRVTNHRSNANRLTNQKSVNRPVRVKTTPAFKTVRTPPTTTAGERQCRSAIMDKKMERELKLSQMQFVGVNTRVRGPSYDLRESPLITGGDHSRLFKSVYLYQNRPTPMTPLKAWKGYNGNIYFDPIKINRVDSSYQVNTQNILQQKLQLENSRRKSTNNNLTYIHCDPPPRPTHLHLDKQSINSWRNKHVHEDVEYIMSREDIGSLMVEKGQHGDRVKDPRRPSLQNVQKGSVAHRVATEKHETPSQPTNRSPVMNIAGGQLKQSNFNPNPLIKATVQFSQSANRPITNSPVPEMFSKTVAFDKMPPLEQFRASLKTMNTNPRPTNKVSPAPRIVTERPPYVKFSREHRVKS